MKKRAFEKLLREAIILEAEERGARLAGVPTEPVPAEAQARFNASLKTERQTAARETTPEIPVKQESRARRIARGWMTAGIAVVTTAALIFVIGLMAAGGMSRGTKAADALPAEQQPPEWPAEHPAEQEPKMPDEVQPEAPEEEPKETSAPAPGGMPLAPVEELPEVKTVVYPWQGYDCLIPEGFVSAHESDHEFISVTSEMNDRNMFQMAYELVPTETLEGWDSDVFSEQHLKILLSKIGVPESQYADFVGHSVRIVENGVVCYHLYNRSQKVYACLARVLSDEKNSLIAVGMTLGEYGIGEFDSIVNAFLNQSSEKETSQTVFEAEALTEDHPAIASLAKASEENALICADLCAQLLVLHESEALPFGLDFILQEISRVAEKDDRVYYNMVIQSGADAYSVQWLSDAGEQHAILTSIYAISSDGEHCIFYTGEHTALLYHVYSEWDEEAIRAECIDKVAAACRIDRWKAESVLKQLDLLCDSLSKDDDLFMYNPMESVICVQETEHTCLIRIVPIFSDQEDAFFMVHTEGIVPVIEQYDVKGTVPLTTADRQKRQENRPPDIEDKTDNTETIAGFSVTKESDEEMTKYLKNRQWKELPEDNDKQGLIEKFAVTGDKCAIGLKDRIYIYDHEECVAGYQFVVSGEFRLFSDLENFYIFDVRSKKFICIDETSGACSLYALTKEAIQKESDKLIWLGVFTAKNVSLNKGEYDLKYEVKAKTISIGNYTLANRNPEIKPLLTASYDTLCYVNDSNESILYTSTARLTWIAVFLVVILVSSIAGIMVIVHFSRRCGVTTETKGTKRCQD